MCYALFSLLLGNLQTVPRLMSVYTTFTSLHPFPTPSSEHEFFTFRLGYAVPILYHECLFSVSNPPVFAIARCELSLDKDNFAYTRCLSKGLYGKGFRGYSIR